MSTTTPEPILSIDDARLHAAGLVKPVVKAILERPAAFEWSLQGFGMLRTYIEPELRLHVWDSRFAVDGVSEIHTHPWHFHSMVVAGVVENTRFAAGPRDVGFMGGQGEPYMVQKLRCGPGGCTIGDPSPVVLVAAETETLEEREVYTQRADEIHRSSPHDGTVTLVQREFLDDTEHAYVYFQGEWVTAEPREATLTEVLQITTNALERWF